MQRTLSDENIDLLALFQSVWSRRWLVLSCSVIGLLLSIVYIFLSTSLYRVEVLLSPNDLEQGSSIPSGLGGLASLAGVDLQSSANGKEALAILSSRVFVEEFIEANDLLPVLFAEQWDSQASAWLPSGAEPPNVQDGVNFFTDEVRSVSEDPLTGLVTLTVDWSDPGIAAMWADELVARINEKLRARELSSSERRLQFLREELSTVNLLELRQALASLIQNEIQNITLARAESEFAFRVIDPARVPNEPIAPRKSLIVLIAVFIGASTGVFLALVMSWTVDLQRKDR